MPVGDFYEERESPEVSISHSRARVILLITVKLKIVMSHKLVDFNV